eukprot:TRINITY_DN62494_c0_g1_i1.p1 TRINITY_DN62494_c0_g1~~TRINITY_DN62494_c0_g1_i1.p1  ORF type:complete len:266 (+),score=100.49 TRINITY_DN62494_c0_g1_i1:73-798(+)
MMKTLRKLTGRELSSMIFDQRPPAKGRESGTMQFIVQPTGADGAKHFADMAPTPLAAFHNDLAAVLSVLKAPESVQVAYGSWNWHEEPTMYITCRNHAEAVAALYEGGTANTAPVTSHSDDATRYVTQLVLAQDRFNPLVNAPFVEAIRNGVDMKAFYSFFTGALAQVQSFEVRITGLTESPCEVQLRTTQQLVPRGGFSFVIGTVVDFNSLSAVPCQVPKEQKENATSWKGVLGLQRKKK